MLRDPDEAVYTPPKRRPLLEQVALAYRIVVARHVVPRMTWDEIAELEGVPKRTLQHFYRAWLKGVTSRRPGAYAERQLALRVLRMGQLSPDLDDFAEPTGSSVRGSRSPIRTPGQMGSMTR
jgi:hypothetical protein